MMKTSCGEVWTVKFFPAVYLIAQKVPELRAITDTTWPSASCSIISTLFLAVTRIELLTHAHDRHRLMLVPLKRSHDELELTRLTPVFQMFNSSVDNCSDVALLRACDSFNDFVGYASR